MLRSINCCFLTHPIAFKCFANVRYASTKASPLAGKDITKPFEEIQIDLPWGQMSGKWYGPKHVRPIVGLHGWQDNAGTFDTLIPLLPAHVPYLCLDLPGHGRSSWLPAGVAYHSIDNVSLIRLLLKEFGWEKISLMAHSMSSINGFVFSSLFPDKVDMLIGLDILKPLIRSPVKMVDHIAQRLESNLKDEERLRNKSEPPTYDYDQLVERLHTASDRSVSEEACKYLLERNIKPSEHEPNKYYFARDNRLKNSIFYAYPHVVVLEMAKRITCPHLFIKALKSPYFENKKYYDDVMEVLTKKSNFVFHEVDGTHHVHLNDPERVSGIISDFINKARP